MGDGPTGQLLPGTGLGQDLDSNSLKAEETDGPGRKTRTARWHSTRRHRHEHPLCSTRRDPSIRRLLDTLETPGPGANEKYLTLKPVLSERETETDGEGWEPNLYSERTRGRGRSQKHPQRDVGSRCRHRTLYPSPLDNHGQVLRTPGPGPCLPHPHDRGGSESVVPSLRSTPGRGARITRVEEEERDTRHDP